MRTFFTGLFFGLLALTAVRAQSFDTPVSYFDFFNQAHGAIVQKNMEYLQYAVHSDKLSEIAQRRLELLELVGKTQSHLAQVPAYEGDNRMKEELQAILSVYQELFEVDFEQVELLKSSSQQSFEAMERYMAAHGAAEEQLVAASERFLAAQRAFASRHQLSLVEGAQSTEARQLNQLNAYQRALFLPSFRVNKANAAFLDAMERQDADAMRGAHQALLQACRDVLPTLASAGDFNGNTAYRDAIREQVSTTRQLAEQAYPALIRVVGTPQNELTQEDVDAYNAATDRLNTELAPLANKVNAALQELLRANVPEPAVRGTKRI